MHFIRRFKSSRIWRRADWQEVTKSNEVFRHLHLQGVSRYRKLQSTPAMLSKIRMLEVLLFRVLVLWTSLITEPRGLLRHTDWCVSVDCTQVC